MDPLIPRASPRDIQDYVAKFEVERGFTKRSMGAQALKLVEEVGEVYRAVDAIEGQAQDPQGRVSDLGEEAADVRIMLISVINRAGIDLEEAFRRKEERNESRVWR